MTAQITHYHTQAEARMSGIPLVAELQRRGLDTFMRVGFPDRTDQQWKYTNLAAFLKELFITKTAEEKTQLDPSMRLPFLAEEIIVSAGEMLPFDGLLPPGVLVLPVLQALEQYPDKIQPYLGSLISSENGILAWNMAMLMHGVFIYVPAGIIMERPLCIHNVNALPGQAVHLHNLVVLEAGSQMQLVEYYQGSDAVMYMTNTVTEIFLAQTAVLTHLKVQQESLLAYHFGHVFVKQLANSCFTGHLVSLGGCLARNDTTVRLDEEHAACDLKGIYTPCSAQHMEQHTHVIHAVPNGRSDQNYKGVLTGQSRAVFDGLVEVKKDAQHTQANQQNKNILLSALAEVNTHPQLQIEADDVVCTHGATVGQLDPDALFYFAARGICATQARQHLIQAFIEENIVALPDLEFSAWLSNCLLQHLGVAHAL